MKKIAILASGSGTNAEALIRHFENSDAGEISVVMSNKENAGVLERADRLGIPRSTFSKSDLESGSLGNQLNSLNIDFIILAGFLLKIPEELIAQFPDRIINIHPALLPKYGGKGMYGMNVHKAVIDNKESASGITIHLVNENYDEGRHLFQAEIDVEEEDTPESLAEKIHVLEHRHFPEVVEKYVRELSIPDS